MGSRLWRTTAGRLTIVVVLTPICGFFAVINGVYGTLGVYSAFKQHLAWTEAGMVYWMLLLIGILCAAVVVGAWLWLFASRKRLNSQAGGESGIRTRYTT